MAKYSSRKHGSYKSLETVCDITHLLKEKGMSLSDIANIAGTNGGSRNIHYVLENKELLEQKGINKYNIVKISSRDGGVKKFKFIFEYINLLENNGYTKEAVIKMAKTIESGKWCISRFDSIFKYNNALLFNSDNEHSECVVSQNISTPFACSDKKDSKIVDSFNDYDEIKGLIVV